MAPQKDTSSSVAVTYVERLMQLTKGSIKKERKGETLSIGEKKRQKRMFKRLERAKVQRMFFAFIDPVKKTPRFVVRTITDFKRI